MIETFEEETGITRELDGFKVGKTYRLKSGSYKDEDVVLTWINPRKNVKIGKIIHNQIICTVLSKHIHLNTVLANLKDIGILKPDYSTLENKDLFVYVKSGMKEAVKEFVKRFGKLPKTYKNFQS